MAENDIQVAADVPDVVKSWTVRPVIVERSEVGVERSAWDSFCAAVEDGNPLHWDEALATGISNGLIVPPALLSWTRPHSWSPHHQQHEPRPLELHFMLKGALQLPFGIVRETELIFLEPLREGDRVVGEQYLREVSEELTTHLGAGRNWMIEVIYQRDNGVAVGIERIGCFGYRKSNRDQ